MKKYILLIITLFMCCNSFAQFKIGNITVDSATFSKYIVDCYVHPDTVRTKSRSDYLNSCNGCLVPHDKIQKAEMMANDFNNFLEKNNIGSATKQVPYKAGSDSIFTIINDKGVLLPHLSSGEYTEWAGYLIPRKPSEQDFVKWFNKNQIQ